MYNHGLLTWIWRMILSHLSYTEAPDLRTLTYSDLGLREPSRIKGEAFLKSAHSTEVSCDSTNTAR